MNRSLLRCEYRAAYVEPAQNLIATVTLPLTPIKRVACIVSLGRVEIMFVHTLKNIVCYLRRSIPISDPCLPDAVPVS